jgi:hypothetical protein
MESPQPIKTLDLGDFPFTKILAPKIFNYVQGILNNDG